MFLPCRFPHFNPRSPCGERLADIPEAGDYNDISIHAPRVGSDLDEWVVTLTANVFQSTLPVWGATTFVQRWQVISLISIHAPRVGSDKRWKPAARMPMDFNPRSPCGERLR